MKNTYYDTLGISKDADKKTIQKAYRAMALANHPDRFPGDKEAEFRFKEAAEAYEVLGNAQKRREYDRSLAPTTSIKDLFATQLGQRFISGMLPHPPAALQDGVDTMMVVECSEKVLCEGGVIEVKNPYDSHKPLILQAIPGYRWCTLRGMGEAGKNGGTKGDWYILLTSSQKTTNKRSGK